MDFLFSPRKMFGLIGGTVGLFLCAVVWLFVLICYITIQQLPFGHADAWRWFVGEPRPVGVVEAPSVTGLGLDPAVLVEWFGGHVTSGFHDPSRPGHNGVDFSLVEGTPIRSTWGGTVVYAGWSDAGYGNLVIVQNGDWQTYYGHLSAFSVGVGQDLQTGTTLGLSGNTGWSTGPHLHYEVRHRGTPVDPVTAPVEE
ncbi:MAG: M23 family metallopeptidase [Chloroflexota bacterium]|nr:M23 family metallopeptidase [Chloroflexota bacterium]